MRTPLQRIRIGTLVLCSTFVIAVCLFVYIAGRTWLDSLYFVVITISGVGFGEDSSFSPSEKILTVGVIVIGMSAAFYTVGGLIQMMTEGELQKVLGLRRTNREVNKLKDHCIICGYGRMGQIIAEDLEHQGHPFVAIERDHEVIAEARNRKRLTLTGDACEEDVLNAAGIVAARSLVSTLPDDASNVFITLTARNLNPDLQIIARADHHSSRKKLLQAGADRVVMPAVIGAQRITNLLTRPSTLEFFELVSDRKVDDVELDEIKIPNSCPLIGTTLHEAEARKRHGLLIVAIKTSQGPMVFNPEGDYAFVSGDILVVMGSADGADRFRQEHGI